MRKIGKYCAMACLALVSLLAQAETPTESLKKVLKGYDRFSANFEQVTRKDQGATAEVLKGSMKISRPGLFRWETASPFPQLIVSDGEYVWIYDPDLEQATRKPADPKQTNGAALILNGDVAELAEQFEIYLPINEESQQLFELLPKDTQSSFQRIRLFFTQGVMSELMLQDVLGQQTTILLKDSVINEPMDASLFKFTPPNGTDVIVSNER
ncbi:outer membrane lipoprotein chaperone LolA [Neptunomonas qingdaonensis]|uniref:Outer-membrane lipoprotein carrier protein n=1 Tax=Neptunomonas qingdaonensis TaxID=1045558 RepID=A0A1I2SZV5_9GAMM|nr:outer membrane lipoprotein chaperone LolA [Neptunomonas qingdaonensis]SFG58324.1 outer membrane lipoprotein carrier protein [Neptunomonas qingdaonensis]